MKHSAEHRWISLRPQGTFLLSQQSFTLEPSGPLATAQGSQLYKSFCISSQQIEVSPTLLPSLFLLCPLGWEAKALWAWEPFR